MTEAVIVAATRSPIGRAAKGTMTELRPDDLAATIVRAACAQVPQLEPTAFDDLILGCAQPAGEQGYNMARVVGLLADLPTRAGPDDQPVLLVLARLDPDRRSRHQGRRGRRLHRRRRRVREPLRDRPRRRCPRLAQPALPRRRGTHREPAAGRRRHLGADRGPARHLHRHGTDRRERRRARERLARRHGRLRRPLAAARRRLAGERLLRPRDHPGHAPQRHRHRQGRLPAPEHDGREARRPQAGLPPRRQGDRRQRLPAERRCRRRDRHERHPRPRARHHPARPHHLLRRLGARPGDHGPRPDRGEPSGAGPRGHVDRRHRPRSRSTRRSPPR